MQSSAITPTRKRTNLVVIAALCLAMQAFALAHFGIVRHVRCAEHGEMVELDEAAVRVAASTPSESALPAMDSSLRSVESHHDHCVVAAERRALCGTGLAVITARPACLVAAPLPRLIVVGPTRPLYRLAPKISPPFAA
jgi:anthranilate/para-aminobenzoate synthase component II